MNEGLNMADDVALTMRFLMYGCMDVASIT
jgi:hypothetical protein